MSLRKPLSLALLGLAPLAACADSQELGRATFALEGDASYFRLRIFESTPSASLQGAVVFDTGCLQQQSRTYELTNIPVGEGYAVAYEGFASFGCNSADRMALGYRGGVTITKDAQPYFHVQVYPEGGVATLPEDLNLSASASTSIAFCDGDDDCPGANDVCYDASKPTYWCVPGCASDADCAGLHPRATCDAAEGWCYLRSPFPLNLSEARAWGHAATLADGDVLFVGGLGDSGAGLAATTHALERFDAQTGLFQAASVSGLSASPGGAAGFAALGGDRFVTVGGLTRATLSWSAEGGLDLQADWAQDISAQVLVWDLAANKGAASTLSRGVARATVVPLGASRFFVAGGLVVAGPGVEATKATLVCELDGALAATCVDGPQLQHPRQAPAATCLDAACDQILLVGGNPGGKLAEVVDLAAGTTGALTTVGLSDKVFGAQLCGLDLVGGSTELNRPTPFTATRLTVNGSNLEANPLVGAPQTTYLGALVGADPKATSGSCWVAGGLTATSTSGRLAEVGSGAFATLGASLGAPRFAAQGALIGAGPLAGRALFAGGLALAGTPDAPVAGAVEVVRGAEVFTP